MAEKFKANGTVGLWWMGLIDRKTLVWEDADIVKVLMGQ
jgi:hypothetical protein